VVFNLVFAVWAHTHRIMSVMTSRNINDMLEQKKQQQFGNKQEASCVRYAACFPNS